jgi:hypothetical protein
MKEKHSKPKGELPDIELEPDAWPRFERFIKAIARAGPQHKKTPSDAPAASPKPRRKKELDV